MDVLIIAALKEEFAAARDARPPGTRGWPATLPARTYVGGHIRALQEERLSTVE
jgi:hypothetical protein